MEKTKTNNNENWVFVPVHKTRLLRTYDKCILIKISDTETCILPLVFKRVKENEEHLFFSLPKDFNLEIRTSKWDEKTRHYESTDKLVAIKDKLSLVRMLSKELVAE